MSEPAVRYLVEELNGGLRLSLPGWLFLVLPRRDVGGWGGDDLRSPVGVGAALVVGGERRHGAGVDAVHDLHGVGEGHETLVHTGREGPRELPAGVAAPEVAAAAVQDDARVRVDVPEPERADVREPLVVLGRAGLHRLLLLAPGCRRLCRSFLVKISYRDA